MSEFKKCEKGHVYDSKFDKCPFCLGKKLDDTLKEIPEIPDDDIEVHPDIADCYMMVEGDIDDSD